jgi:hypothetical protein
MRQIAGSKTSASGTVCPLSANKVGNTCDGHNERREWPAVELRVAQFNHRLTLW